jgi:hypothetical protein
LLKTDECSRATESAVRRDLFIERDDKTTEAPLGAALKIGLASYVAPNGAWRGQGDAFSYKRVAPNGAHVLQRAFQES